MPSKEEMSVIIGGKTGLSIACSYSQSRYSIVHRFSSGLYSFPCTLGLVTSDASPSRDDN